MILLKEDAEKVQQSLTTAFSEELDKVLALGKDKADAHRIKKVLDGLPFIEHEDTALTVVAISNSINKMLHLGADTNEWEDLLGRFYMESRKGA